METRPLHKVDHAIFGRPYIGERVSGDTAVIMQRDGLIFAAIVDVAGYGPDAHSVACDIKSFLQETWSQDVVATTLQLHEAFKGTRGASVGMGVLNIVQGELSYTGIGNTIIRKFGSQTARLYSTEGVIGNYIGTPIEQRLQLATSDIVILHTDGVRDHFKQQEYLDLDQHSVQSIAKNIIHRFGRLYDDAMCVVLRYVR